MSQSGQDFVVCAFVGCENQVPRREWPSDKTLPKICDEHLRANQSRPSPQPIDPIERSF